MRAPLLPVDEALRQDAVDELELTTELRDTNFDRITRLLGTLVDVPITAFSVIDKDRQFFKSIQGLDVRETPRDVSFCGHAILGSDIMVVEDAATDERFADNPLVTADPNIRFYAGIPVMSPNGAKVGTLCAIDRQQRRLSEQDRQALEDLRGLLESELVLRSVSVRDHLTELFNRRYFDDTVGREWRRALRTATPLSLMLLDIDRFKAFNDLHGHARGDECLRRVAGVLRSQARRESDLFCRFGGEEFAAILPATDREGAQRVGEALRQEIEDLQILHPGSDHRVVTASVGVATAGNAEEHARGYAYFLNQADEALYAAKRAGRNQVMVGGT